MVAARWSGHRYERRYGRRIKVLHLADAELDAILRSPFAAGELTTAADIVVAIAHVDGSGVTKEAVRELASLPCLVIGADRAGDTAPHLDTADEPDVTTVDALLDAVDANPIASVTLALLLRGVPQRSIGDGLVAESAAYSVLQAGPEFARWLTSRTRRNRPAGAEPPVLTTRDGDHLTITLNRPRVRNALDRAMRDALLEALTIPAADPTVTTVGINGNGPVFCSGGDLDEFGSFDDPASAHVVRTATSIGRAVHAVRDRTTVHLHGHCAGSGIELAAFAGHVIATPDTLLSLPEISLGLVPGAGGTVSLPRRAGRHRVALLALSGAVIDAARAEDWGLVDAVTPLR
jgi:enoyl-CoA hydratase/carnithine racemase